MIRLRLSVWQRVCVVLAVVILAAIAERLFAAENVLKVCQDPNNMPFSNTTSPTAWFTARLGCNTEEFEWPKLNHSASTAAMTAAVPPGAAISRQSNFFGDGGSRTDRRARG